MESESGHQSKQLKLQSEILIEAPAELCYQIWLDSPQLVCHLERVLGVRVTSGFSSEGNGDGRVVASQKELQRKIRSFFPASSEFKHWHLLGPEGRLHEIDNTILLEIPNRYICTMSLDDHDVYSYSEITFTLDALNRNTLVLWQVSVCPAIGNGAMARLVSDISKTKDHFLEDCLQDFKILVESKVPPAPNPTSANPCEP